MDACTPKTVLVIDDAPSIVRVLTRLLRREGYRVETAANGRQGLAHLRRQGFDVILSDLCMPDLDGRALYEVLQQQYPAQCERLIFLTGASDEADTRVFLAQCGRPWLSKPCPLAALRRAMRQVLARATPAPPHNECQTRSQQLQRKSQQLRRESRVLLGAVQALYTRNAQLRRQAAACRSAADRARVERTEGRGSTVTLGLPDVPAV
jgi:DNA-binding response OmpR family regulator